MAAVNMTEGNITKHLVRYSVPLILGNLFQLTYNAVDSIIAVSYTHLDVYKRQPQTGISSSWQIRKTRISVTETGGDV